jgi:hypothetical protein
VSLHLLVSNFRSNQTSRSLPYARSPPSTHSGRKLPHGWFNTPLSQMTWHRDLLQTTIKYRADRHADTIVRSRLPNCLSANLVCRRWLLCLAVILSPECLASAQLLVASIALLTDAVGDVTSVLTILEPPPTTTTTTVQTTQVAGGVVETVTAAVAGVAAPVEGAANVLVTNIVQTTTIDSTPVLVTSQVSVPILPAITSGATTLAVGSNTYTLSINAEGNTVVNGKTAAGTTNVANGVTSTNAEVLETVIGGQTMQEVVISGKTVGETVVGGKTMAVWATVVNGNTLIESSVIDGTPSTIYGAPPVTKTIGGSTTTATNGSRTGKSGLGVAAGVGIGVGCTVLLVMLGALLLYLLRRARRRRRQREEDDQEMSAIVTADDDRASSVARSDAASEKFEIDGHERRPPVELPGDYWPTELAVAHSRAPSSLYARDVKAVPDHYRQDEGEEEEEATRAQLHSQDAPTTTDTLSGIVSPIARSNSERDWPLMSAAGDVSVGSLSPAD